MPEERKISPAVAIIPFALGLAALGVFAALALAAPPKVYPCPYCEAEFATEEELLAHIELEHPEMPPPEGEAEFAYVSGIRLSNLVYMGNEYFLLEIDIQNVGQVPGVCTITCYYIIYVEGFTPYWVEVGWYDPPYVRTAVLQPGEVVTFSARVNDVYRFPQKYKVESEAGVIESPLYPPYWKP